jgi:S-DNA-T family DNA segregation ATPase FtsK/SpoIIIE
MPTKKAVPPKEPANQPAEKSRPTTTTFRTLTPEQDNIVINSRSSKPRKAAATKKAAGTLTLEPPLEKKNARDKNKDKDSEAEIVIKSSTTGRRPSTTSSNPGPKGGGSSPRRPSSAGPGSTDGRSTRSRQAAPPGFHETDRVPPVPDGLRHEITGIILIVTGLILLFGLMADQGVVAEIGKNLKKLIGLGAFIVPPLIIIMGGTYIWEGLTNRERFNQTRITGLIFMVVSFVSITHLAAGNPKSLADDGGGGGYFAYYINEFMSSIITGFGVGVMWLALFLIGLMLLLEMSLKDMTHSLRNTVRWLRGQAPLVAGEPLESDQYSDFDDDFEGPDNYNPKPARRGKLTGHLSDDDFLDDLLLNGQNSRGRKPGAPPEPEKNFTHTISLTDEDSADPVPLAPLVEPKGGALAPVPSWPVPAVTGEKPQKPLQQNWQRDEGTANPPDLPHREWSIPSISILASFSDVEVNPQELRKKARLIENTLSSFGVEAYVREVNTGPTVTQFALEPGIGVKVARITALANDMALALAAPAIRIEAPVPGQSRVGIEVPNNKIATVGLREIMEAEEYAKKSGRLKFGLGRDVAGQPMVADLAKMPHLLIAGSTGSGKSVCLNSIVASYLLQYRPSDLQFIMIDPKMVELSTYNGIPHLRFPVVTQIEADPEKERKSSDRTPTVMSVLKWSIREMERRYKQLSLYGHRNIESWNKAAGVGNELEKLPYLVLIVDELADLMMVAPEEAEAAICRLAQKARAVGIHLILATQRPSVDVVTGLIKANFPSRITFAVTSQIDSRVILDMAGAEKLLGRGDMLYLSSDASKPIRVQGVYVSDEEIDSLVQHWRQQTDFLKGDKKDFNQVQMWPKDLQEIEAESQADETDELFEEALQVVREARSASTSLLQRKLRVGYNRAARLIEELAQAGIIGHADGGKPRPVLIAEEDLNGPASLLAAANDFVPAPVSAPVESTQPPAYNPGPAPAFNPTANPGQVKPAVMPLPTLPPNNGFAPGNGSQPRPPQAAPNVPPPVLRKVEPVAPEAPRPRPAQGYFDADPPI